MHFALNSVQFISSVADETYLKTFFRMLVMGSFENFVTKGAKFIFCQMFVHLTVIQVLNQRKPYDANFITIHPSKWPATQKQMA